MLTVLRRKSNQKIAANYEYFDPKKIYAQVDEYETAEDIENSELEDDTQNISEDENRDISEADKTEKTTRLGRTVKRPDYLDEYYNLALYGLKDSPRCWNNKFNAEATKYGFTRSSYDSCLYYKKNVWLVIYVDDIIITGEDKEIQQCIIWLKREFNGKEMGQMKEFLRMSIERDKNTLKIRQTALIDKYIFMRKVASLCQELDMKEIKEQVVFGLHSKDLSNFRMSKEHADHDELYQDIMTYERITAARRGRMTTDRKEGLKEGRPTWRTTQTRETTRINEHTPNIRRVKCYNCNEEGHIATECTRPRRPRGSCYQCGSTEHLRTNCPGRITERTQSRDQHQAERRTLLVEDATVPAYIVSLNLEKDKYNIYVDAVLDSGSPITIICNTCVKDIDYNANDKEIQSDFRGINKSKLEVLGCIEFNAYVANISFKLKAFVVPDDVIPYKCLLGRDFITNSNLNISFINNKIVINPAVSTTDPFTVENNEILSICYVDQTELPDLNISSSITYNDRKRVIDTFKEYYIKPERPSKSTVNLEMKIVFDQNHVPFYFKHRRLSFAEKNIVKNIVDELLKEGIIRKINSEYSSPILLIKKHNRENEYRMVVDFRELNKHTLRDNNPLPIMQDHIDQLRGKRYFTCLDLKSAFHHVPIESSSIKYTSFVTPMGQYEYTRVPFGLKNSPAIFSRHRQCF
ncbi:Zinc knuckle [Popillia japonica]|uniref:Zinc knuckle n=1 Tax=Popillia japonica TaxID=7064 RepID=A0AAW1LVJ0_POPJA